MKFPLNRLRGGVVDSEGPFEPIEEDLLEVLKSQVILKKHFKLP